MTRKLRNAAALATVAGALGLMNAAPAGAQVWNQVASGTTQNITAIEYLGPGQLWYVTGGGQIARQIPGGFDIFDDGAAASFRDIEMAPNKTLGLAGGTDGDLYRTTDGGDSWTKINQVETLGWEYDGYCYDDLNPVTNLGNISRVKFARDGKVAFLFAGNDEVLQSTGGGNPSNVGAEGTWERINVPAAGGQTYGCKIAGETEDAYFAPGDQGVGWTVGDNTYKTNNALQTVAEQVTRACSGDDCRLAVDPANTQRHFSLSGGYIYFSNNAWAGNYSYFTPRNNDKRPYKNLKDIAFAGGTVIGAGDEGNIDVIADGINMYHQTPPASAEGVNFKSVDGYDATHFAVGGEGGVLLLSQQANFTPDIDKPKVTIAGPTELPGPGAAAFTADVTDEGGSGVDDSGVSWTVDGPVDFTATGRTAAFTLPSGYYSIRVRAKDKAGNESDEDFHSILVRTPTAPPFVEPVVFDPRGNEKNFFLAPGSKPPAATTKGKGKKKKTTINIRGVLGVPATANKAIACKGNVTITITANKRLIPGAIGKAKVSTATCKYAKKITFLRSRVKGKKVTVTLEFPGNSLVAFSQYKKQLTLKK